MRKFLVCEVLIIFLIFPLTLRAELNPPLKPPLYATSSFGEYRDGRFHMGVDYRAGIGTPVYAVDDGYVIRIRCGPWGYGKAIYVQFNQGFIGVYAHLDRFGEPYQSYIRKIQHQRKSFSVDITLDPNELTVKKGQVIAYAGNSGTQHPHLHFELRDRRGVTCLNPRDFGFDWVDLNPPLIRSLLVVPGDLTSTVNGRHIPIEIPLDSSSSTVELNAKGRISFCVDAFDSESGSCKLGVYRVLVKEGEAENCVLHQSRLDYETANSGKVAFFPFSYDKKYWVLWKWEGNRSPNYCLSSDGFYTIGDKRRNFEILVEDFHRKLSSVSINITPDTSIMVDSSEMEKGPGVYVHYLYDFITFEVILTQGSLKSEIPKVTVLNCDKNTLQHVSLNKISENIYEIPWSPEASGKYKIQIVHPEIGEWEREIYALMRGDTLPPIDLGELKIKFHSKTPFKWCWFSVVKERVTSQIKGMEILSDFFSIQPDFMPIDEPVELEFSILDKLNDIERVSLYRASGDKWSRVNSKVVNNKVHAKIDRFGRYAILKDNAPPKIYDISIKDGTVVETRRPNISCKISDYGSGIASANIYCNDKWLLAEYDGPRGILKWAQDEDLPVGKHAIIFEVTDYAGLLKREVRSIIVQDSKHAEIKKRKE